MDFLQNHIEALVFCAPSAIKVKEIRECLTEMFEADVPETDIQEAIKSILEKYATDEYAFELVHSAGGYQFMTKPAYQASISILLKQQSKRKLSNSALETLSIIAYKQPVTKGAIEQIRGVNCDYSINKLLDKELIEIRGKAETVGRPILYGTSEKFMEYFSINDLSELPTPRDFAREENVIGEEDTTLDTTS